MPLADAEIAKLALNCYVTMKISYANMIGSLCSSVPGTDVYKILEAVGADSRVGSICLKPATAYGGPCFPRDTRAMIAFADEIGTSAPLVLATQQVNDVQSFHLLRIVRNIRSGSQVVGVLGLAYKTTTAVIEKSAGMDLVGLLRANNIPVETFDRLATEQSTTKSAQECVDKSDVIVIMLPEPDFWPSKIEYGQKPIIDCWDIIGKRS
jgi:UDPglucose 6-dehydrogenase